MKCEDSEPDNRVHHWTLISQFIQLPSLRLQNLLTRVLKFCTWFYVSE